MGRTGGGRAGTAVFIDDTAAAANRQMEREAHISLVLLAAVYSIQYLDQILVGLFAEPIKAEFGFSDTEMGLITGLSFTLFYAICGIPLARLADRANRKHIIVASLAIFSVATAACGLAGGFASLFIARIFVAIGEAGTTPASVSILADRFTPAKRQLTMSLYTGAGFAGTAIGLLAIGLLSSMLSWRSVFQFAGLLGVFLAAVVAYRLREPFRPEPDRRQPDKNFFHVFAMLLRIPSYRWMAIGMGLALLATSSAMGWIPAFLIRSHAYSQTEVVLFLALGWGGGATIGTFVFGLVNARLRSLGGRLPLIIVGLLILGFASLFCLSFTSSSLLIVQGGIISALFMIGGLRGPIMALVQDIIPREIQATATASILFITYVIGAAVGPVLTGAVSDFLSAAHGADSLRLALIYVIFASGAAGSGALFYASRRVEDDIAAAQRPAAD